MAEKLNDMAELVAALFKKRWRTPQGVRDAARVKGIPFAGAGQAENAGR